MDVWSLGVLFYYLLFGDFPFKGTHLSIQGINMLDDIYSKCKGGFKLSENIKVKGFFRTKKEEGMLNDLFQRIFEVDRAKRVAIGNLK